MILRVLRELQRSSRPKAMNIFYKDSFTVFTHSNLKTDMTGNRLNITEKIFVRKFPKLQE